MERSIYIYIYIEMLFPSQVPVSSLDYNPLMPSYLFYVLSEHKFYQPMGCTFLKKY